jgi:DNA invertase Pin-like site-specific DNA recombinase
MVKKCYENVPSLYFDPKYEIKGELFVRNRKETAEKTYKMHEYLDEVELCLFNQISSRFDEILSVLRTIESLECIVVFNANRLHQIRQSNMDLVKQVSSRHLRIVTLLKKQERLKSTLAKMADMK